VRETALGGPDVRCERPGPLPLVNHFLERLGVPILFEQFVARPRVRRPLDPARALGVLLRSIIVEREPIYRQQETVRLFLPCAFELQADEVRCLSDDAVGRALDRLFDADRAAMLTELVVAVRKRFGVGFRELHNDSTSIKLTGQYAQARGRSMRGRRAPWPSSFMCAATYRYPPAAKTPAGAPLAPTERPV